MSNRMKFPENIHMIAYNNYHHMISKGFRTKIQSQQLHCAKDNLRLCSLSRLLEVYLVWARVKRNLNCIKIMYAFYGGRRRVRKLSGNLNKEEWLEALCVGQLRIFNVFCSQLKSYYQTVVDSTLFYAVACWGSGIRTGKQSYSVVGLQGPELQASSDELFFLF